MVSILLTPPKGEKVTNHTPNPFEGRIVVLIRIIVPSKKKIFCSFQPPWESTGGERERERGRVGAHTGTERGWTGRPGVGSHHMRARLRC